MILIIAPEDDLHATVVADKLSEMGHSSTIWNTASFPKQDKITWSAEKSNLRRDGTSEFDLAKVTRIWWRRYRKPKPSSQISDDNVRNFCAGEADDLLRGMFTDDKRVTNNPESELRANFKVRQLSLASKMGVPIPATVISNDSEIIRGFIKQVPQAVMKTLRCDYPHGIETRICNDKDFPELETSFAPTIVQELVFCEADIRLCVIGDTVFAAELRREDGNVHVDWRATAGAWQPHDLPPAIGKQMLALIRALKLDTASIDLRLKNNGVYVFLEVNPSGQFLFLDIDAGLPVVDAFARHLTESL